MNKAAFVATNKLDRINEMAEKVEKALIGTPLEGLIKHERIAQTMMRYRLKALKHTCK